MMGGDWYAFTDAQLQRILDGELDWLKFLFDELPEKPRECFSKAEPYWNEIRELLSDEDACGLEVTTQIPEATGYSFASDVEDVARRLSKLAEDDLRKRYAELDLEPDFAELYPLVKALIDFYQRAATNRDAVLFRVT